MFIKKKSGRGKFNRNLKKSLPYRAICFLILLTGRLIDGFFAASICYLLYIFVLWLNPEEHIAYFAALLTHIFANAS